MRDESMTAASRTTALNVAFLVRQLGVGGAERQLELLAAALARRGHQVTVVTLYDSGGATEAKLRSDGVRIVGLAKRGRWDMVGFAYRLLRAFHRIEPDVIYSMLPTGNVLGVVSRWGLTHTSLVWGIRNSGTRRRTDDILGSIALWAERRLANCPDAIVANSLAGRAHCIERGFPQSKLRVVRNGVDGAQYYFEQEARDELRSIMGAGESRVIGFVGRLQRHVRKGIEILMRAMATDEGPAANAQLWVVGKADPEYEAELKALAKQLGIGDRTRWLGPRAEMRGVYSAIDVVCLPSLEREGMPNVLTEGMACGCVCVGTDTGDTAYVLGDGDLVCEPGNVDSLRAALTVALRRSQSGSRDQSRQDVLARMSLTSAVDGTELVLREVVHLKRRLGQ